MMSDWILLADRFLRLHYYGFSSSLVLVGAASAQPAPTWTTIGLLLAVAAAFHVFAYVQNDVLDLHVDRTQPLRADDPLVTGTIQPWQAKLLACAQVPLAAALIWRAGAPPAAYLAMAAGFALMTIYNLYGKRCPVPPLTDLVQALAWGSLAIVGALLAGRRLAGATVPAFAYAVTFIFLINGVHGGLRDLANDLRCGMTTTASVLGSRPVTDGTVESSPALQLFAWLAFAAIVLPFPAGLLGGVFRYDDQTWWLVVVPWLVLTCASAAVLRRVVRRSEPERDKMISIHGLLVLLPLILVFLPLMSPRLATVYLCSFVLPLWTMDPRLEWTRAQLTTTVVPVRSVDGDRDAVAD
jgi:4-hydroxybenzoate polyprenyltransferase